jgi:hypothetical protein|tara:strand:+ start:216 stop:938 length:723 start_codon:yes stop_codon:yes gene_type:complete
MALKSRKLKVNKDKTLSKIQYGKLDIMWFFQWLKVCVDLEGQSIEFNKTKSKGGSYGSATGTIKRKIKINGWKFIDLKEIKSAKHHLKMTNKELFNYLNKMFNKYIHLFGDYTIRYIKSSKDLIQDDNYFVVQIPISKNRAEIDIELEKLKQVHKIPKSEKTRTIVFHRPIKHKEMKRLYDVWLYKNKEFEWQGKLTMLNNGQIARRVGYGGFRQVQLAYVSAKNLLVNMSNEIFPKNTL